jgi:hypothetical protein
METSCQNSSFVQGFIGNFTQSDLGEQRIIEDLNPMFSFSVAMK